MTLDLEAIRKRHAGTVGFVEYPDVVEALADIPALIAEVERLSGCVHCGEPMGRGDDACMDCYSSKRGMAEALREYISCAKALQPRPLWTIGEMAKEVARAALRESEEQVNG